jgi:shikimate kinase
MIQEGVNDPSIFKAIFLAGGPGSGKSFIVGKTALTSLGFKVVNSDEIFEIALKKAGLQATPSDIYSPQGQAIRQRAKETTKNRQEKYIEGRLGLVIDGTGKDYDKIVNQAKKLKMLGYDVAMIFVNTDLNTAMKRNRERPRSLPDSEVSNMWKDVQKNLGKFQNFFGSTMMIVDNSEGSNYEGGILSVYRKISAWSKKSPNSREALKWIASQKAMREDVPSTNTTSVAGAGDSGIVAIDRRYRKDNIPRVLKRFRGFMRDSDD